MSHPNTDRDERVRQIRERRHDAAKKSWMDHPPQPTWKDIDYLLSLLDSQPAAPSSSTPAERTEVEGEQEPDMPNESKRPERVWITWDDAYPWPIPEMGGDEYVRVATASPTSTSDNARRAAEEIVASVSVNDFRQVQRLNRVEGIAAIISKHMKGTSESA